MSILEQVANLLYARGKPATSRPGHSAPKFPDPDETFLPIVRIMVLDPPAAVRGLSGGRWHNP